MPDLPAAFLETAEADLSAYIPREKVKAILSILPCKDEVLELADVPKDILAIWIRDAVKYCNDSSNRASVSTLSSVTTNSSGTTDATKTSQVSTETNTTYDSNASNKGNKVLTQVTCEEEDGLAVHAPVMAPLKPPSAGRRKESSGPFFCPTCGYGSTRSNGLQRHMESPCESQVRFKCRQCPNAKSERKEGDIRDHVQTHGKSRLGFEKYKLPAKLYFGCTFCGELIKGREAYIAHARSDNSRLDVTKARGCQNLRLRALIQQSDVLGQVMLESMSRGWAVDAYLTMVWNNVNARCLADSLEYGVTEGRNDEYSSLGISDLPHFVKGLLDQSIRLSSSSEAPTTDLTAARAAELSLDQHTGTLAHFSSSMTPGESLSLRQASQGTESALPRGDLAIQIAARQALEGAFALSQAGMKRAISPGSRDHADSVQRARQSPMPPTPLDTNVPSPPHAAGSSWGYKKTSSAGTPANYPSFFDWDN